MESIKINCEGSRTASLGSLKPFQGNLKNLSESAYVKLRGLIQTMGFSFPIFVWNDTENNQTYILDGHQRVRTLQKMASEGFDIPDLPVADVNAANYRDAKKKLMAAASQFGDIDKQGLYEFMSENDWEFDFLAENFKLPDINFDDFKNEFITEPPREDSESDDDVPEVDEKDVNVKLGDIWQLGNHRLMCGDSTDKTMVDKLMDGNIASFCFTSPPYLDQRDYRGDLDLSVDHLSKFLQAPCDLFAVNLGFKFKDREIQPYWNEYIKKAKEYGHKFLSWNVWDKDYAGSISNQSQMFSITHEWIFIFGKYKKLNRIYSNNIEENKKRRRYDPVNIEGKSQRLRRQKDGSMKYSNRGAAYDKKQMSTVLVCHPEKARNIDHPAKFPVELPECYLLGCTEIDDLIYEPFCGSGSTLIACEKTNRKCFGMEIDPHYCQVIIDRWEQYTESQATLIHRD